MREALLSALRQYPVFSVRSLASTLGKRRPYAYLVAYRLKKAGAIHEIEKGKYTVESDPFLVASWVVWPSYISGWAALHYHKMTEQLPFAIQIVTTRRRKNPVIFFKGTKLNFTYIKKSAFCGYARIDYAGRYIFMAQKEKAIADALASKRMSFAEAAEIVRRNRGKLNIRRLLSYANAAGGPAKKLKEVLHDKPR